MTLANTIFAPLLEFLATQTADDAKAADAKAFEFETEGKPTDHIQLRSFDPKDIGDDVIVRTCCALGSSVSPSVDPATLSSESHEYRPKRQLSLIGNLPGGGKTGYVYTRRGGFLDLGHVRDYVDYTRFFAFRYRDAPNGGFSDGRSKLFSEAGDIHLVVSPRTDRPSPVLAAMLGAKLAYQRAVWHEVATYFSDTGSIDQQYSSFAPEDNFSNAVGVLAGYRAVLTPKIDFNQAADKALLQVVEDLGPANKEQTDDAVDYVADFWFESSLLPVARPNAKRRNFNAFDAIRPWLVTDIAVPGKQAKGDALRKALGRPKAVSITLPSHYNGLLLDNLAHLEIRNIHPSIKALVPSLNRIKPLDLRTVVNAIRTKERQTNGNNSDSPGPAVP